MKKFLTKISVLLMIFLCLTVPTVQAFSWSDIHGQAKNFIAKGEKEATTLDASELVNGIANILTTIGVTVVFAGLLIIGVKYMVATPEEAAKLKTKLVGLVVAGVVIIGAFGIWTLARTFFERNHIITQYKGGKLWERIIYHVM